MATSPFLTTPGMLANQQQMELAKALMQRGMGGPAGQMVDGHFVSNALPNAIQSIAGGLLSNKATGDATKLQEGQQKQMADQLRQYMAMRQGGMPADGVGPAAPANPGGAQEFALGAVNNPMLQQLGLKEFEARLKQNTPLSQKDILGANGFDAKSRLAAAMAGDMSLLTPEAQKGVVAEGQLVDPTTGKLIADVRPQWETRTIGGDLYQQEKREGGKMLKLDNAPKVSTTVNNSTNVINKGETKFAETLGKDTAEEFKLARQDAQAAYKQRQFVGQMQELEKQGIFSGPTANVATTLNAVGQTLGLPVDGQKLANSQAYQQQFAAQVANVLTSGGGIGRSMTDADRKAFEQSLPTMLMNPQGRQQVYRMLEADSAARIGRAQSFQQQLLQNPQYKDAAGMLTMNPVDSTPLGRAGGVQAPGAVPVPGVGAPRQAPQPGVIESGYRFKGGNPADKNNWEKVQ